MSWQPYIKDFKIFLQLEKSLSPNSIEAYARDIDKLLIFMELQYDSLPPTRVELHHLTSFLAWVNELGLSARSQARIISGIKSFYKFLLLEDVIETDPTSLLEPPRIGRKLPEVLNHEEVKEILAQIDLSTPAGRRNKAMLEVLYGCGLRVSELTELRLSHVYFDQEFVRVTGKGNKERLVPIGRIALKEIRNYLPDRSSLPKIERDHEDILFLNRRGRRLSRVMVFTMVKDLV